ncbi:MAG TPA: Gfo/Idh/MocA family oxidoreductase [Pyrinomonadaceae bacterium]|jgi:predicted dehydrogenase|nr:Gfo/Idh/MocA family oxidoreductase [Pyrinomonadaceae bacterium]
MSALNIGVIGCGYWGPNLLRNFAENEGAQLRWICDLDEERLASMARRYPMARTTTDYRALVSDPDTDAVAVVTPVATHYPIARELLRAGKHVLLEKPFTATVAEAEELIELAEQHKRTLMVDHTFIYTGAVRKMKELVNSGELGDLLYFDSVRINLGLFQRDINVLWDLAPHDLSIMDYLIERRPQAVSALGSSHIERGIENIAYLVMLFEEEFIAHFHFNWLAPVKIRRTMIAGSSKMVLYDDIEPTEKVRVYDSGVTANRVGDREADYQTLVSYRTGDVWAPKLDSTEALRYVVAEFLESIRAGRRPLTDGQAGLRVVQLLEAAQKSMKYGGQAIILSEPGCIARA